MVGGFGGDALARVAGTAVASDGDLTQMALSFAGSQLEGTAFGDTLDQHNLSITGDGLGFSPGSGPVSFHLDGDGDFGAGLTVDDVSIDWSEGGAVSLGVHRDDWTGSITDEGAVSFAQNLGNIAGEDITTWAGLRYDPEAGFSATANQVQSELLYDTYRWGTIDLQTGQTDFQTASSATLIDVFDETFGDDGRTVGIWPTLTGGMVTVPTTETPGVTAEEALAQLDLQEEDPDFSVPESAPVHRYDPPGPLEEVVVIGQAPTPTQGPAPGTQGPVAADPSTGPSAAEHAAQAAERAEAAGDIAKGTADAIGLANELGLLEASGQLLGAAGLAGSARALVDAMNKAEQEVRETGNVSAATAADIADATSGLRSGLEGAVGLPKSIVTRALGTVTGVASEVGTFFDPDSSTLEQTVAALNIAAEFVPPTSPVGVAIHTFDISTSVGTAARELALTTPVYDYLYATAEQTSASLDAAGDATEAFLSDAGRQATDFIVSGLGVDPGSSVQDGFDAMGATADGAFDAIATVADDVIVLTGAVNATITGVIWAGLDAVAGD